MSPLWLQNVTALSLQIGLVAALTAAAVALGRIRSPRVLLGFHQAALGVALVAPLVQPWRRTELVDQATMNVGAGAWAPSLPQPGVGDASAIATYLLAAGAMLRLAWLVLGSWRLARYRRAARPLDPILVARVDPGNRLVGTVRWLASADIAGPATYGLFPPVVLAPEDLERRSAASARSILLHELVHVRRRDWLFVILEEVVRAAFWFHPGVWWFLDRIHLHREQVVDEEVVALTGDRRGYLAALLESASGVGSIDATLAPAWLRRRHLKARIVSVLKEVPMSRRPRYWSAAALALVVVSAAGAAALAFPLAAPPADTTQNSPAVYDYDPANGIMLPVLVKEVRPQYTPAAMQAKIEGTVLLGCVVKSDGRIDDVAIIRSLDAEYGLDDQAVAAAKQWEFKPGTKDGTPVAVRVTIELRFRLK